MGWGKSFKKFVGAINPVAVLGTAGQVGMDYLAMQSGEEQNKEAIRAAEREQARNLQWQQEFAQNGIRWRVEDAKAAGIHPLAAVGASGASFSPSTSLFPTSDPKGEFYSKMGQNFTRAASAAMSKEEKIAAALRLENMHIENEMKKIELKRMQEPPTNFPTPYGDPGFPGQPNASGYGNSTPHPDRPAQEAGYTPDVAYAGSDRVVYPYIPTKLAESYESDPIGSIMWRARNTLLPYFNPWASRPPARDLPKGYDMWRWTVSGGWKPVKVPSFLKARIRARQAREENPYKPR